MVSKAKQKEGIKKRLKAVPSDKGKATDPDFDKKKPANATPHLNCL